MQTKRHLRNIKHWSTTGWFWRIWPNHSGAHHTNLSRDPWGRHCWLIDKSIGVFDAICPKQGFHAAPIKASIKQEVYQHHRTCTTLSYTSHRKKIMPCLNPHKHVLFSFYPMCSSHSNDQKKKLFPSTRFSILKAQLPCTRFISLIINCNWWCQCTEQLSHTGNSGYSNDKTLIYVQMRYLQSTKIQMGNWRILNSLSPFILWYST